MGGSAARRNMRGIEQAEIGQVGHDIADRRRRERDYALRQGARADRFAGRQVAFDDLLEDVARALVEALHQGLAVGRQGHVY